MRQLGQRMPAAHIGRRDQRAMRQSALAIHANVPLHAEVPQRPFPGLMHLRIALLVFVLRRAGRDDDRRIDHRAGLECHAAVSQYPTCFCEQLLAQLVLFQQIVEPQQAGCIRYRLAPKVETGEPAQADAVVQRILARLFVQVEAVLQEVNPHHALKSGRRPAVALLRGVRSDYRAQCRPWQNPVHFVQSRCR